MKKLIFSSIVLVSVILSVSCKKQLKEFNPGGLTDENLYTTKDGINSLVNGAYSFQRFWYGKEVGYFMSEGGTDLWVPGKNGATRPFSGLLTYNLTFDNVAIKAEWQKLYQAVNLCNNGLSKIDAVKDISDAEKTRLKGELSFLRAFYLWHLVETWGEVPFVPSGVITNSKQKLNVLYDYMISDLEYACKVLGTTAPSYGRANKNAARAFLSKVYLTRGYGKAHIYSYFTQDDSYFQKAIDTAKTLIGKYTLVSNYADLWKMSNMKNTEVIYALDYSNVSLDNYLTTNSEIRDQFDLSFSTADKNTDISNQRSNINQYGGNNGHLFFNHTYDAVGSRTARCIEYGRPFARFAPTKFLLDLYNDTLDSRFGGSFQTVWFATNSSLVPIAGDTSILISKTNTVKTSSKWKAFSIDSMYNPTTGKSRMIDNKMCPALLKFMDNTRATIALESSERDVFIFRYAEVLLILAEANIKLGNTGEAVNYVNMVRTRAAKSGKTNEMQVSASEMTIDFILDERAREFAGEQMRWFDLSRTNKLEERVKKNNPDISGAFVSPTHLLRPIPRNEVQSGGASQNAGY